MNVNITIERSILPLPPVDIDIKKETKVAGPYWGFGSTLVAGYKSWFVMADANYGKTSPGGINNSINFTFLSARSGFAGNMGENNLLKVWLGAAYLYSTTTLEIKVPSETLGEVLVRIEQHPVNPWTFHSGFLITINNKFDFMAGPVAFLLPGDFSSFCPFQSFVAHFGTRARVTPGIGAHQAAAALLRKPFDLPGPAHATVLTSPRAFAHDGTGVLTKEAFCGMHCERIRNPAGTYVFFDHIAPANNSTTATLQAELRAFARARGLHFAEIGEGICHQLLAEGIVLPGEVVVGADSHTCTLGAFGAFASGVGATDMAAIWASGGTWFRVRPAE